MEEARRATCPLLRPMPKVKTGAKEGPTWWEKLKQAQTQDEGKVEAAEREAGFSFGTQLASSELELDDVPW